MGRGGGGGGKRAHGREKEILSLSHCEKGIRARGRREIRWTRMRTLLCPERAYTVGTLMSARMKAWALLCLSLAKLPQQVACSAGSPAPFQNYRSPGFYLSLFSSRILHLADERERMTPRADERGRVTPKFIEVWSLVIS